MFSNLSEINSKNCCLLFKSVNRMCNNFYDPFNRHVKLVIYNYKIRAFPWILAYASLSHFQSMFHFYTPWKPGIFWCFQLYGSGWKWVNYGMSNTRKIVLERINMHQHATSKWCSTITFCHKISAKIISLHCLILAQCMEIFENVGMKVSYGRK